MIKKTEEKLFASELVDGSRFRKYRKLRHVLLGILITLSALFASVDHKKVEMPIYEFLGLRIEFFAILIVLLAICWGVIYLYSTKKTIIGVLVLYLDRLEIHNPEQQIFLFNDMTDLEINRGSTYHYEYQKDNVIIKFENFIKFIQNNNSYVFEFLIDSGKKNELFEKTIKKLKSHRIPLLYKSI